MCRRKWMNCMRWLEFSIAIKVMMWSICLTIISVMLYKSYINVKIYYWVFRQQSMMCCEICWSLAWMCYIKPKNVLFWFMCVCVLKKGGFLGVHNLKLFFCPHMHTCVPDEKAVLSQLIMLYLQWWCEFHYPIRFFPVSDCSNFSQLKKMKLHMSICKILQRVRSNIAEKNESKSC